jgi:hypothetical protein
MVRGDPNIRAAAEHIEQVAKLHDWLMSD